MEEDFAFTEALEIVTTNRHYKEDQANVQAELKKAKDAEYQAHIKNGNWELT